MDKIGIRDARFRLQLFIPQAAPVSMERDTLVKGPFARRDGVHSELTMCVLAEHELDQTLAVLFLLKFEQRAFPGTRCPSKQNQLTTRVELLTLVEELLEVRAGGHLRLRDIFQLPKQLLLTDDHGLLELLLLVFVLVPVVVVAADAGSQPRANLVALLAIADVDAVVDGVDLKDKLLV